MQAIRILLVDDHTLLRDALSQQLAEFVEFEVVGGASDAGEAMELAFELKPDVIVMDIDMPGMICFDAVERIRARLEKVAVLFLTGSFNDHYIERALKIGAAGYLHKSEPAKTLAMAIREIAAGGEFFTDEVRARVVSKKGTMSPGDGAKLRGETLTDREIEVLRYLARGLSKKEVAGLMHLSPKTIESHSTRLMDKLDIHDRVELARYAIREGLAEA
jgi:DNA-binding NarL/FixJ family response regulator